MIEGLSRWMGGWVALLCLSCVSGPGQYKQTADSATNVCFRNPACYSQTGNDAILPWVGRAARAATAAHATQRVLEAADVARIEYLLVECAKEAHFKINEREYGEGKSPDDAECLREVGKDKAGDPILQQTELGRMKHERAFKCVQQKILRLFPDNISIEPRYGPHGKSGGYALTNQWAGSMKPDIVTHAAGQPGQVQCVYDFKFPCIKSKKEYPFSNFETREQITLHKQLKGKCNPAIVTPQLGVVRE
ncbi:hypothetical protein OV208_40560 [Corallococcus sp. bb12-1]|uniref:hypothetical protein n=1 Tax=Corallococcus sp. bb12-1 TaxID=2996784 RepID=UPI00226F2606|nr:hypothetical protein [Corallococcus sp. bb12-1]MCY1047660.1 hypothetical protein [Corallococcus sp. bb12-1]